MALIIGAGILPQCVIREPVINCGVDRFDVLNTFDDEVIAYLHEAIEDDDE